MKNIFKFNLYYFFITIILFCIELCIATLLKNIYFIRAFLGDVLVVIFLYTAVLSFIKVNKYKLIFYILAFSFFIEFMQYFKLAEILGFSKGSIPYIILGNYFSIEDLICYVIGCIIIYVLIKVKYF